MNYDLEPLDYKHNFAETVERMEAFWAGEMVDRPACAVTAPLPGKETMPGGFYMEGAREDFGPIIERVVHNAGCTYWGGEAMPHYVPSFGPDQFAAWMGADLRWSDSGEGTNWVAEFVDDWRQAFPLHIETEGKWWQRMLGFMTQLGQACRGKLLVSHLDLHSNADALSAIRTPAKLCTDFYDCPYELDKAMRQVRGLFPFVYETFYQAAEMWRSGTLGWVPIYHPRRSNTIQCDFLALISPEHGRKYVMPALEEEASYLDACSYHYDGPECLPHFDDIMGIKGIHVIQWTRGARNKPDLEWMDLLKEIQARGKAVWLSCSVAEMKLFHRELKPELVFYNTWAATPGEADGVLEWLVANT